MAELSALPHRLRGFGKLAALIISACADSGMAAANRPADPASTSAATPLAIVDVRVVTMRSTEVASHQTVLIRDGRIEWVGPVGGHPLPADATVIQGAGRFLAPALIDMHVHLRSADLEAYVSNGIATVRNMWGFPELHAWTAEITAGTRLGPTIVSASPGLDGPPAQWPLTVLLMQPESARAAVQVQKDAGWAYLKVYSRLSPAVFDSVMAAAHDLGMIAVGHVPWAVDIHRALAAGMKSIEHFTGYDRAVSRSGSPGTFGWADADPARYAPLVAASVSAGVWNCPTLAIYAEIARKQHSAAETATILQNRRLFVKQLFDAGAQLLAGTDAGIDVVAPGTSLHDELDDFVAAGLTPYQALRLATSEAARFLGRSDLGIVAEGAEASVLLLRDNPLGSVKALRAPDGMVLRGAWRSLR